MSGLIAGFPIAVTFATYMQSTYRNRVKEIREYGYRCGSQPKSILIILEILVSKPRLSPFEHFMIIICNHEVALLCAAGVCSV